MCLKIWWFLLNLKHAKNKKWINKDGISKMIHASQLSDLIAQGWQSGRGKTLNWSRNFG